MGGDAMRWVSSGIDNLTGNRMPACPLQNFAATHHADAARRQPVMLHDERERSDFSGQKVNLP